MYFVTFLDFIYSMFRTLVDKRANILHERKVGAIGLNTLSTGILHYMKGGEGPIDLGKKRHENEVRGARSKKYAAHYDREEDGFVFPKKPIELNVTETFTLSRAILDRYTSDS